MGKIAFIILYLFAVLFIPNAFTSARKFKRERATPPCKDDEEWVIDCPSFKDYCKEGNQFYGFMKENCKKTCAFCREQETPKTLPCKDDEEWAINCPSFKDYCKEGNKFYGFMKENCKKTCGFCGVQENPIDGGFTEWDAITGCSKSCGGGTQKLSRSCTNPRPRNGGSSCHGATEESRKCNTVACPEINCADNLVCDGYKYLCKQYPAYMKLNCMKTCNLCGEAECGKGPIKRHGRVVGEVDVTESWPWQAGWKVDGKFHCGGSLIDRQWVLTAAHCISTKDVSKLEVTLGDTDRDEYEGTEQTFGVAKIVSHQQYDPLTHRNDIALLKLDTKAALNEKVGLICLSKQEGKPPLNGSCYITGWGRTRMFGKHSNLLQESILPPVANDQCKMFNKNIVTDHMLCAEYGLDFPRNRSSCQGDSGGPYVCQTLKGKKWELHGVVSWGSSQCMATKRYSVFTRVSMYQDWIKDHMKA